jgi:hypothetical protein
MKKGRPHAKGIHNTTRSELLTKVGIPIKSFKDRENRRMREILSLTTQIVNNDPTVREQVLANLNSDNKVEQNGSINKKEATERMNKFMGQVVGMVRNFRCPVTSVSQDCSSNSTRSNSNSRDSIRSESTINVSTTSMGQEVGMVGDFRSPVTSVSQNCSSNSTRSNSNSRDSIRSESTINGSTTSEGSMRMVLDSRNSVASEMEIGLFSNNQDCFSNSTTSGIIEIGTEITAEDLMLFMEDDDNSSVSSMEEQFGGITKLSPQDVEEIFGTGRESLPHE